MDDDVASPGHLFPSRCYSGPAALLVQAAESAGHTICGERESGGCLAERACPCWELQPAPSSHLSFFWFQTDNLSSLLIPIH